MGTDLPWHGAPLRGKFRSGEVSWCSMLTPLSKASPLFANTGADFFEDVRQVPLELETEDLPPPLPNPK
eukprot:1077595-Amphidinium_carterae.1